MSPWRVMALLLHYLPCWLHQQMERVALPLMARGPLFPWFLLRLRDLVLMVPHRLAGSTPPLLALQLDDAGGQSPDAEHQKTFMHICNAKRPKKVKAALILEAISEEEALAEEPDKCLHQAAIVSRVLLKKAPLPEGAFVKLANLFNFSVAPTNGITGAAAPAASAPSDGSLPVVTGDSTAAA